MSNPLSDGNRLTGTLAGAPLDILISMRLENRALGLQELLALTCHPARTVVNSLAVLENEGLLVRPGDKRWQLHPRADELLFDHLRANPIYDPCA